MSKSFKNTLGIKHKWATLVDHLAWWWFKGFILFPPIDFKVPLIDRLDFKVSLLHCSDFSKQL